MDINLVAWSLMEKSRFRREGFHCFLPHDTYKRLFRPSDLIMGKGPHPYVREDRHCFYSLRMRASAIFHFGLVVVAWINATTARPTYPYDHELAVHHTLKTNDGGFPVSLMPHLDRRGSFDLGDGWWMHYDALISILPWPAAAQAIEGLFQAIYENANGAWQDQGPQHYLEVLDGDLKIEFFSELQPMSWAFIAGFADTMSRALDRGFISMFDMRIVAPSGVVVYVHLRVKQALAAAAA